MDCILNVPYLDLGEIRKALADEGYGAYVNKRIGGLTIGSLEPTERKNVVLYKRNEKLEKCMISFLKKIQIRA